MRILCAYYNPEGKADQDDAEIRTALAGHEVTFAIGHEDVQFLMDKTDPPFDVILMDVYLLWSRNSVEVYPSGGFIFAFISRSLVRGLGMFIPPYFETVFERDDDEYHSTVASRDCFDFHGRRDWAKLLDMVVERMKKVDKL